MASRTKTIYDYAGYMYSTADLYSSTLNYYPSSTVEAATDINTDRVDVYCALSPCPARYKLHNEWASHPIVASHIEPKIESKKNNPKH